MTDSVTWLVNIHNEHPVNNGGSCRKHEDATSKKTTQNFDDNSVREKKKTVKQSFAAEENLRNAGSRVRQMKSCEIAVQSEEDRSRIRSFPSQVSSHTST